MAINAPKIIGFCGYPGSGKDAAAKFLIARGWQRIAFADKLRSVALGSDPYIRITREELAGGPGNRLTAAGCVSATGEKFIRLTDLVKVVGMDEAKKVADVRRFLQKLGTEGVRDNLGELSWVDAAERSIEPNKRVVITDCRFANEAEMIRRRGGLICNIFRLGVKEVAHNSHISESYPFTPDCGIENNGTLAELENRVLELAGYSL